MRILLFICFFSFVRLCYAAPTIDHYEYKPEGKSYKYKGNLLYYGYYLALSGEKLTILYRKSSNGKISFKGCWITKDLAEKLPMVVVRYIGKYIAGPELENTQSLDKAVAIAQKAVTKALDQTWLNALKNDSEEFSNRGVYKRENAGFDMNYYEFFPIDKHDFSNPTDVTDTIVLKTYADSILSLHKVLLEKNKSLSEVKDNLLKKPDFDKSISWHEYRYNNLMDVIEKLKTLPYHHKNLKISDWPQASTKRWGFVSNQPNEFHTDVDSTCKYLMMLQLTLKKGEPMPAMAWKQNYGNWKATRCNIFAGDFSQQALNLQTYPWGTKDWNAHKIHSNLASLKDFVRVSWDKAWDYANLGYPIFITTPKVKDGDAGHIALAFPVDPADGEKIDKLENAISLGMVVQAGGSNGLKKLGQGFVVEDLPQGAVYIFLGHLR